MTPADHYAYLSFGVARSSVVPYSITGTGRATTRRANLAHILANPLIVSGGDARPFFCGVTFRGIRCFRDDILHITLVVLEPTASKKSPQNIAAILRAEGVFGYVHTLPGYDVANSLYAVRVVLPLRNPLALRELDTWSDLARFAQSIVAEEIDPRCLVPEQCWPHGHHDGDAFEFFSVPGRHIDAVYDPDIDACLPAGAA